MSTTIAQKRTTCVNRPIPRALRENALRIIAASYPFMDSPIFAQRGIEAELMDVDVDTSLPRIAWYHPTTGDGVRGGISGSPTLMGTDEEQLMFHRYNYAKKRLTELKRKVGRETLTAELAEQLVHWHQRYEHFREYLVRTNLALVLAMARRMRLSQLDFADVISEGNMALLRTVEKFDTDRGFKFSTYACRAILQAFGRAALKLAHHRGRFPGDVQPNPDKSDWPDRRREIFEGECLDELKVIVDGNLANLTLVEQTIIRHRFNWQEQAENPLTLDEVGKIIGMTRERVRQIQNDALAKIRQIIEQRIWGKAPARSVQTTISRFPGVRRIETDLLQVRA